MKTITVPDLVAMQLEPPLQPGVACHRLGKHYCTPMIAMGQCTTRCQDCKDNLCNIFENLRSTTDPVRDPAAFLVYNIREMIAELKEREERQAQPLKDEYGRPLGQNIYSLFAETLK